MRRRVIILGAGFGGLECAKKLDGKDVDVLILDRNNFHTFTPLLYQVASSLLNPSDICFPVRKAFRGSPNVRFRQAEVVGFDFPGKRVLLRNGDTERYDHLVVAAGTRTHHFGNETIEKRSLGLKNISEALELRNHVLRCLEEAGDRPVADQTPWMTFVIVGGGPTGIEYAGALAELMALVVKPEYPMIREGARIVLVEGRDELLPAFHPSLGAYARQRLEQLGVEVRTGQLVDSLVGDEVRFKSGEVIESKTLVWSAGVRPEDVAEDGPTRERSHRMEVDAYCRIPDAPGAFAIGDIAGFVGEDGAELPMVSPPAMQQGRYVADFILQQGPVTGRDADPDHPPFRYWDKGMMATIGRGHAVAQAGSLRFTGIIGWFAWLIVHIYYLIGFRNRLLVLGGWSWNYIFYDRPVRIIAGAKQLPALPGSD